MEQEIIHAAICNLQKNTNIEGKWIDFRKKN